MDLGILQLGLTLVITSLSVIKYVDTIDTCSGALCLGPVFKVSQNNDNKILVDMVKPLDCSCGPVCISSSGI